MVLDVAFPVLFPLFSFLKDKEDALITLWFDVEANIAARVVVQFYPPSRRTNSAVWPIFCFLTFYSFLPFFFWYLFLLNVDRRRSMCATQRLKVGSKKSVLWLPLFLSSSSSFFFFLQPFFDVLTKCS